MREVRPAMQMLQEDVKDAKGVEVRPRRAGSRFNSMDQEILCSSVQQVAIAVCKVHQGNCRHRARCGQGTGRRYIRPARFAVPALPCPLGLKRTRITLATGYVLLVWFRLGCTDQSQIERQEQKRKKKKDTYPSCQGESIHHEKAGISKKCHHRSWTIRSRPHKAAGRSCSPLTPSPFSTTPPYLIWYRLCGIPVRVPIVSLSSWLAVAVQGLFFRIGNMYLGDARTYSHGTSPAYVTAVECYEHGYVGNSMVYARSTACQKSPRRAGESWRLRQDGVLASSPDPKRRPSAAALATSPARRLLWLTPLADRLTNFFIFSRSVLFSLSLLLMVTHGQGRVRVLPSVTRC